MTKKSIYLLLFLFSIPIIGQNSSFYKKSDTLNTKRRNAIAITESVMAGSAFDKKKQRSFNYSSPNTHCKKLTISFNSFNSSKEIFLSLFVSIN